MRLEDRIFNITDAGFEDMALEVFRFQYAENGIYRLFSEALNVDPARVNSLEKIPYLPVSLFKSHDIVTGSFTPEAIFESSGTTATGNSRHLVRSLDVYRRSFITCFNEFYGAVDDWCVIGLLPSYLERSSSSLVVMADELIKKSNHANSGFYLYDHEKLAQVIKENESSKQKTLLIGVTFALLDFADEFRQPLKYTTVMETGGMKGRRKEITREEVHALLMEAWQIPAIHSEYGMTELLSQAYSSGHGIFRCPPWMRIVLRSEDDPLQVNSMAYAKKMEGLVNVIDLANIYSCAFIAVDDIGRLHTDGSFEIMGRMDSSDVRGCSLMVT